jgi:putative inorganic carbon (HCO3(-)) transporter
VNATGGRLVSSLGNPDFLGQFVVMIIPLTIIEVIYAKRIWNVLVSILFGLTFFVLLASGTRSSWLTFIILLFLLPMIFLKPKTPIYIYRKAIFYVLFFALLIAVNFYLPAGIPIKISVLVLSLLWVYSYLKYIFPYIRESLKSHWKSLLLIGIIMITVYIAFPYVELLAPGKNIRLEEMLKNRFSRLSDIKGEGRIYIIKDSLKLGKNEMLNNPIRLIFGFGPDTVGKVFIKYKGLELARKDPIDNITYPDRAHNEYLDTFLQTGILGLVTFILILYSVIKKGISIHRTKHPYRIFAGALTLGIIGFATNGVFIFGTSATYLYFYIFCGIIGVINTPKGNGWKLRNKIYPILISSLIIFCVFSTSTGIKQIEAHRLLLKGVETFNNRQVDNALKLFEASFKAYPIGYTAQRELEIYNIKMTEAKSKETAKRFFNSGEKLFPIILKYVKYPTSSHYAIAAFYMDGYKIDRSYLKDVLFHLKKSLDYDPYYKPALRALANIYNTYLHNPKLTYEYSKRYIEIEQRDIFMWKMLMRSARDGRDWETVKFSAEAIYLATEKKDKEAEKFLEEAERMINLSKNP